MKSHSTITSNSTMMTMWSAIHAATAPMPPAKVARCPLLTAAFIRKPASGRIIVSIGRIIPIMSLLRIGRSPVCTANASINI